MYLPKSDSGRLIVGTWWMVVLVVVTTYCGNLVAFLTFPKMEMPIETVWQLLAHGGTYTWGYKGSTYMEKYLQVRRFIFCARKGFISDIIHFHCLLKRKLIYRNLCG